MSQIDSFLYLVQSNQGEQAQQLLSNIKKHRQFNATSIDEYIDTLKQSSKNSNMQQAKEQVYNQQQISILKTRAQQTETALSKIAECSHSIILKQLLSSAITGEDRQDLLLDYKFKQENLKVKGQYMIQCRIQCQELSRLLLELRCVVLNEKNSLQKFDTKLSQINFSSLKAQKPQKIIKLQTTPKSVQQQSRQIQVYQSLTKSYQQSAANFSGLIDQLSSCIATALRTPRAPSPPKVKTIDKCISATADEQSAELFPTRENLVQRRIEAIKRLKQQGLLTHQFFEHVLLAFQKIETVLASADIVSQDFNFEIRDVKRYFKGYYSIVVELYLNHIIQQMRLADMFNLLSQSSPHVQDDTEVRNLLLIIALFLIDGFQPVPGAKIQAGKIIVFPAIQSDNYVIGALQVSEEDLAE